MKRGVFGIVLLTAIFFGGLWAGKSARQDLNQAADAMDLAARAVLQGDIEKTAALTLKVRTAWDDNRLKYSILSDQQQVREIDSLLDEAEVFLVAGERVHCGSTCAVIKNRLKSLLEDQQLQLHILL